MCETLSVLLKVCLGCGMGFYTLSDLNQWYQMLQYVIVIKSRFFQQVWSNFEYIIQRAIVSEV